jgi:CheY-like chemotaxis protein
LGEEVLLRDNFSNMVSARCCYTVQVEESSSFYIADITTFRQLAMFMGVERIQEIINEKLTRRVGLISQSRVLSKQLSKEARHVKRRQQQKEDRQKLRLPPCTGYYGAEELEDMNDWLKVVFHHRKAPANYRNPTTLSCLDGLGLDPRKAGQLSGPGIVTMLKAYADENSLQAYQMEQELPGRRLRSSHVDAGSGNPMGQVVAHDARYMETPLEQTMLQALPPPPDEPAPAPSSAPPTSGIFFQTQLDVDEYSSMELKASPPAPATAAPPAAPPPPPAMARASSMPALARVGSGAEEPSGGEARRTGTLAPLSGGGAHASSSRTLRDPSGTANQAHLVMKAFHRVMPGKSILVFTELKEVRKTISKALLPMATEVAVNFVRSTPELLSRLRDRKEAHHALLLDLEKPDLQVEGLIKTTRQFPGYERLPIVVLSAGRELSEAVQSNCSFVVFHPLAASMLREALLWCFDRRTLQRLASFDMSYVDKLTSGDANSGDGAAKGGDPSVKVSRLGVDSQQSKVALPSVSVTKVASMPK